MSTVKIKWFVIISILTAVAACNQSEPPDGSQPPEYLELPDGSQPPDGSQAAVPGDHYPLVDGATWTYRHSSKSGWDETVTIVRSEDNGNTFITTDTPTPEGTRNESTLVLDGTSVYRVAKSVFQNDEPQFSVVYDPGFLRFDAAWLDKEVGFEDTRKYKRTETDVGESPKDPREREHTFVVQSIGEKMTVAGRTFRDCVRIKRKKEAVLDETGALQSDVQEKLFWFAPGVGKILEQNLSTQNYEELIEYDIPE